MFFVAKPWLVHGYHITMVDFRKGFSEKKAVTETTRSHGIVTLNKEAKIAFL